MLDITKIAGQVQTLLCSSPTFTLFAVTLIIGFKYLYSLVRRDPKLAAFAATIPGPPSLPIIGNGFDIFLAGDNAVNWLVGCHEKYGSIFRIWVGKQLVVFLSDVEDLEFVFRNPKTSAKPALFQPFQDFWGDGLFTSDMHIWKKTRKLQLTVYTNNALLSYVPDFNDKIYGYVETLKKSVDGPEFDILDSLPYLSFDIIAKTALGVDLDARDRQNLKFHDCIRKAFGISIRRMFTPWLQIKPISYLILGRTIAKVRSKILNFSEQLMKDRFDELQTTEDEITTSESSTIKPFMQAAYRGQLVTGSDTILRDEIATVLTGGTDTVALTNAMCLLVIAAMPDIQNRLYDEIFEVFGADDRPADMNDISRLPFLNQVLYETMRKYPLGSLLFKSVEEDLRIGERIFPSGTTIMIPVMAVQRNPKYYPNPQKLDPENFAPDAVEKRPKLAFLGFGAGARNCVGKNYAILEVKLTLIALLRAFEFRTTLKLDELKIIMGFNNLVADGYKMSITLRDRRPSYMRE